ncbi:MAG: lipase secretion chaperone [Thermodesulfobacteriota bacterium]
MNKKKLMALGGAVVVLAILAFAALKFMSAKEEQTGYIFDNKSNISFSDQAKARDLLRQDLAAAQARGLTAATAAPNSGQFANIDLHKYFAEGLEVGPYTLKYFKYLTKLFKDSPNMDAALKSVKDFLYAQLPPEEAERVYKLYEQYLRCEIDLMGKMKDWGNPTNPEDIIAFLRRIQDFRRERMGAEVADAMWGGEIKMREYAIRRGAIVKDENLYGAEKEKKIKELSGSMWGEEANLVEDYNKPYNRYQERLAMYQKDLAEMQNEEDKKALDHKFREEFFTPEQVKRLDDVDAQLAVEKKREDTFAAESAKIKEDAGLSEEEKQKKLDSLIDKTYGDQAEEARRRMAIEKGREDLIRQHEGEVQTQQ